MKNESVLKLCCFCCRKMEANGEYDAVYQKAVRKLRLLLSATEAAEAGEDEEETELEDEVKKFKKLKN